MPIPITDENQVVEMYDKFLSENSNVKIAIIGKLASKVFLFLSVDF